VNKERKSLLFLVICVGILLFVGASQVGSEGVPKGTLTISGHELNLTIDPLATTMRVTVGMVRPLMFDPLIKRGPEGDFLPALAVSWEAINDTTWEFKLREGVKFHNGEPFNAYAVKTTYDELLDRSKLFAQGFYWAGIEKVEVIDEFTVRIITIAPMGPLLANLATVGAIVPPSYDSKTFASHPIGTGPFKYVDWVRGDHLTVEANLDYWGGPPKLEKVILYPITEEATRVATAMTGEIDIVYMIPNNMASIVGSAPDVELMTIISNITPHLALGGFARPPIGGHDGKVLRAIDYAIDRERIANEAYYGYAIPAVSCVSPSVFGHHPIEWREYNPEKAKQLLAEVGWDPENVVEAWFVKGSIPGVDDLAILVHSMLKEVGIELSIRVAPDWSLGAAILNSGNFDIFFEGFAVPALEASSFYFINFHPEAMNREGADTYKRGKELAEAIEDAMYSVDEEAILESYKKVQEIIWEYPTRLPLVHFDVIYAVNKSVKGFEPAESGVIDYTKISIEQ